MPITFNGGTTHQQNAITTAHASLGTAVSTAQTRSATGGGPFTTWFGPAAEASQTTVSTAFGSVATALQDGAFAYDFSTPLPDLLVPNVYVLFQRVSGNAVPALVWDGFWTTFALVPVRAADDLVVSVLHETAISFVSAMTDFLTIIDGPSAAKLASTSPALALSSPFNYMGYLAAVASLTTSLFREERFRRRRLR